MILIVDNFDSFTYNLVDYFNQLDLEVEVLRNNASLNTLCSNRFDAIVLSPGPGKAKNAGNMMKVLKYYHKKKPILGICLGHQAIAEFFYGEIIKAQKPMHGKLSLVFHENDIIFKNIPSSFSVVRYHSLVCNHLPSNLKIIAKTKNGEVMAIKHEELPIYGLQFHPEAVLTQYGLDILKNWMNINSITN